MDDKCLQRIDGLLKTIDKVEEMMDNITFSEFCKSRLMVDAISFSVAQIGERMIKLEELLSDKYPNLPWKKARGMRNIIFHDYDNSDPKTVYNTAVNDLPVLKQQFLKIKDDIKQTNIASLNTKKLTLRPWDDLDVEELFELAKEPEIGYWCGWEPHQKIQDTLFVLHNFLEVKETYCICLNDSKNIIGSIGLIFVPDTDLTKLENECEIWFWIGKRFWGNGFAFEAANKLIEHAFQNLGITTIWCCSYDENKRSERVQEKLGFSFHHSIIQSNSERPKHISCLNKQKWLSNAKN